MIRKTFTFIFGLVLYLAVTASPLLAATGSEDEVFHRPFNVLWLAVFLMGIAVFLSLAHWHSSEEA
ncbi:MAG: hypothetical protein QNJ45_23585 [Ardenticatenaceae bacterium]|nr:hypothetical protein [Ardenticatenaceae bacterium]